MGLKDFTIIFNLPTGTRYFMRLLPTLFISLISTLSFGQDTTALKKDIVAEIKRIDKNPQQSASSCTIPAMKKVLHYISYTYTEEENGLVKVSRQFSRRNDTTRQTFYLKKGQLIFATEEIVSYYQVNNNIDSSIWSGAFYFSKGKLLDHITLGHGKSETEDWEPGPEMLRALDESKKDIARYKKMEKRG
jgi:hypothetical protein